MPEQLNLSEVETTATGGTPAPITSETFKQAGIPDTYVKGGNYDLGTIGKDLGELTTIRAERAEREKLIPKDGKYDLGLPKGWKAPEGAPKDFTWSVSEHKMKFLAPFAKELGLPQAKVSEFVAKWAEADAMEVAGEAAEAKKHFDTEMAKLGTGVEQRLGTLFNSLKGAVGEEGAKEISLALGSAAAVEAIEKLISLAGGPKLAPKGSNGNGKERPAYEDLSPQQLHRMAREQRQN